MLNLLIYCLIASVLSLVGGVLLLWRSEFVLRFITPLLAFAAGTFLGVSFFDILPESVEMAEGLNIEVHSLFIAALVGFTAFFILERFLMRYAHIHGSEETLHVGHEEHTESLPLLVVFGDALHNFLDGIFIALSYIANPALGLTATLAIAAHEVPQEISDFSILLDRGWSKAKILWVNIAASLLTLVGVAVGYFAATAFEHLLPYLLASVAGIFIYISASDLIPEIHHRSQHKFGLKIIVSFILGLVVMALLVNMTHA